MAQSHLEEKFLRGWKKQFLFIPLVREYQPLEKRQFRLDFAHIESKVGIEIHGGIWSKKSAHNSGHGLNRDYEKLNLIQSDGWLVYQLSGDMLSLVKQKVWLPIIANAIKQRSPRKII
jgi:very-short-patch-repair endonuclease